MRNSYFDDNPFYNRLDANSPFGDSRDGEQTWAGNWPLPTPQDALSSRTAPIGNRVDSEHLTPYHQQLSAGMTEEEKRHVPYAMYNPGIYADMIQLLVPLTNGVEALALGRPSNTRVMLIIQNPFPNSLYVTFDQVASVAGLIIPSLGNILFDTAVPQNDIHLYYAGANVNVPVFFMNADIARASS